MFASAYLTLASIIQGVALAALVQRVEGTYGSYDATCWVMVAATFLAILVIWHEYLVMVIAYEWTPSLIDSVVPFVFVAAEVFTAHFVAHDVRNWLFAYSAIFAAGFMAWLVTWRQTASGTKRTRPGDQHVVVFRRVRAALVLGSCGLALAAGLLYNVLGLYRVSLLLTGGILVLGLLFVGASIRFWDRVASAGR